MSGGSPPAAASVTIVVPTFGRDGVLVGTLERLVRLDPPAEEIVVVDQTPAHDEAAEAALARLEAGGAIRRVRLARPSIPGALNRGLLEARGELAVVVDDDVEPTADFVAAHRSAHPPGADLVVGGQVLQPGEEPAALEGERFEFRSSIAQETRDAMGGNFSVRRAFALSIGGFDESFAGAAYRFESDFCLRARKAGARIRFEPRASLRHLRAARGGTRAYGSHLTTMRPHHAVGEYYFLLRHRPRGWLGRLLGRPWRAVATRFHARRPWRIPATWVAEFAGLAWAIGLVARPPRLLPRAAGQGDALP